MRLAAILTASALLFASAAEARTVVKMDTNGVKTITMDTPRGVAVIRCDRNNAVLSADGAVAGLDPREICRRN